LRPSQIQHAIAPKAVVDLPRIPFIVAKGGPSSGTLVAQPTYEDSSMIAGGYSSPDVVYPQMRRPRTVPTHEARASASLNDGTRGGCDSRSRAAPRLYAA